MPRNRTQIKEPKCASVPWCDPTLSKARCSALGCATGYSYGRLLFVRKSTGVGAQRSAAFDRLGRAAFLAEGDGAVACDKHTIIHFPGGRKVKHISDADQCRLMPVRA